MLHERESRSPKSALVETFLSYGGQLISTRKHTKLFTLADSSSNFYYVTNGRFALRRTDPYNSMEPLTTALLGPGDFFGWEAVMGDPRMTNAVAESDAMLIPLQGDVLRNLLDGQLHSGDRRLYDEFTNKFIKAEEQAEAHRVLLANGTGMQRTASALLDYSRFADYRGIVKVDQLQIAQRAGLSREYYQHYLLPLLDGTVIDNSIMSQIQILDRDFLGHLVKTYEKKYKKLFI